MNDGVVKTQTQLSYELEAIGHRGHVWYIPLCAALQPRTAPWGPWTQPGPNGGRALQSPPPRLLWIYLKKREKIIGKFWNKMLGKSMEMILWRFWVVKDIRPGAILVLGRCQSDSKKNCWIDQCGSYRRIAEFKSIFLNVDGGKKNYKWS